MAMKTKGLSRNEVLRATGLNQKHFATLIKEGLLQYLPDYSSPLRKKVDPESLWNLIEGEHYVECLKCGAKQAQMTTKHLRVCSDTDLDHYQNDYPDAPILCTLTSENKAKTEAQKRHQSRVLKKRFQTPEGEKTRKQISEASKRLMQTGYRQQAAEHLRQLNRSEKRRKQLSKETTKRWEEDGDLRAAVMDWHADHPKESKRLAAQARSHIRKVSKIHKKIKSALVEEGIQGFITEYEIGFYAIDEANPDLKIAVEVDGCYWHSCPLCGLEGPLENKDLDKRKNSYLENRGWRVIRIWEHDINADIDKCIQRINLAVKRRGGIC